MSRMELNRIVEPSLDLQVLASDQKKDPDFTEITSNPSLYHQDPLRHFNRQAKTHRPASTSPEDFRLFPCSANQPSKDTVSLPSLPPLQPIPEDTLNPVVPAPVPPRPTGQYTRRGRKVNFSTRLADYVQLSSVVFVTKFIFNSIQFAKMDVYMDMDIAAEETSPLLQGQKFIKPFSNFFQTAKQKFADFDPESAVHLVGPMFELTAPIDKDKSHQDFDAVYPEKCVSYGPTICSFGLSYNDHNYAKPVGLTPPVMAPHLMDDYPSRSHILPLPVSIVKETIVDAAANNSNVTIETSTQLLSSSTSNQAKFLIKTKEVKSPTITVTSPSTSLTNSRSDRPVQFDVPSIDPSAGLSDSKKALFAAWHAKAAASGGTLLVQHNWKNSETQQQSQKKSSTETETINSTTEKQNSVKDQIVLNVPRYCRSLGKESEGERVYLESDMKILEVPEELCVSPSKLSSLDSSDEEDLSGDGAEENDLGQKPAMWSTVSCVCEMKTGDSNMIQCLNCRISSFASIFAKVAEECSAL
nr:ran binding protein 9 [Hymenolepis microstoma]CDS35064.2 ran binding protein 9 [Hymenolepis microstoma]